jgi:glutathione S-transferase
MTLYSGPLSMFGAKVQIAALEKGLSVDVVMVPFTSDHRYEGLLVFNPPSPPKFRYLAN